MSDPRVVHVTVRQGASLSGIVFGCFLLWAVIYHFWPYFLAAAVIAFIGYLGLRIRASFIRAAQRNQELIDRAVRQNQLFHKGDPRGIYGEGMGGEGSQ